MKFGAMSSCLSCCYVYPRKRKKRLLYTFRQSGEAYLFGFGLAVVNKSTPYVL
jgi:hypothetical protein